MMSFRVPTEHLTFIIEFHSGPCTNASSDFIIICTQVVTLMITIYIVRNNNIDTSSDQRSMDLYPVYNIFTAAVFLGKHDICNT